MNQMLKVKPQSEVWKINPISKSHFYVYLSAILPFISTLVSDHRNRHAIVVGVRPSSPTTLLQYVYQWGVEQHIFVSAYAFIWIPRYDKMIL